MNIVDIDSSNFSEIASFRAAILVSIGAPAWNGCSLDALMDALVWDGMTIVKPPFIGRVRNAGRAASVIVEDAHFLRHLLIKARAEYVVRRGADVDVQIEIDL